MVLTEEIEGLVGKDSPLKESLYLSHGTCKEEGNR